MQPQLAQLQADVVNAFLDEFEVDEGWTRAFIHAEFELIEDTPLSLAEAFLVRTDPDPERPDYISLGYQVLSTLEALHAGYRQAGQGFAQLDLLIASPDGRYRFEFSTQPSRRLAGERDPDADTYLTERYCELLREA
jgi:hypothetical protein